MPIEEVEGSIVPIIKPPGITSFEVVRRIRKVTGIKKVGHAGTLDPFAEGVLVVGIGRSATRQLANWMRQEKEYIGRITMGVVTDTYDPTGKVVERNPFEMPDTRQIQQVLSGFTGDIKQVPPIYSALKVKGMRMYKAARKGIAVERESRTVRISQIELMQMMPDGFEIRAVCSHGTYIRSLAHDIGKALGPGAHLSRLIRTRIGNYTIDCSEELEKFLVRLSDIRKGD